MITWMQKHKKYLVITIWISAIAFIGAGFVGWGAYDFNKNRATSMARVGHKNVSVQEFQQKYYQLFDYYNSVFNGQLSKQQADEMGLENLALQASIEEALLINFAQDIGLRVSEKDVLNHIVADSNFHKDGVFDKNVYYDSLRRARISPSDYEKNLQTTILLSKLMSALRLPANSQDLSMFAANLFMQDKVSIEIISADKSDVKVDDSELKKLWQESKNQYMNKPVYDIDFLYLPSKDYNASDEVLKQFYDENKENYKDDDDKILAFDSVKNKISKDYNLEQSRTDALKKYVEIKKSQEQLTQKANFNEDNATLPFEFFKDTRDDEVLKPFKYKDGFVIAKVVKITPAEPMSFEQAKSEVLKLYLHKELKVVLEQKAKNAVKNFKGKDIGYVSKDSSDISGLSSDESTEFITKLFQTQSPSAVGYVMLDNRAVVYKILEQKLLDSTLDKKYSSLIEQNSMALKNSELTRSLINELRKVYEVEEYYKR